MSEEVSGYCVKYALTKGVFPLSVRLVDSEFVRPADSYGRFDLLVRGSEWVPTLEEALAYTRKAASHQADLLRRRLAKLEALAENPRVLEESPFKPVQSGSFLQEWSDVILGEGQTRGYLDVIHRQGEG